MQTTNLVWTIQARKHVYNIKTCLFQYKTIGNEQMFTSLILLYLAGAQVNAYQLYVYVTEFVKRYLFHTFYIPATKLM